MKFLVAIHRPNDFNHAEMLDEVARQAIDDVNDEMVSQGVRLFVGGLQGPSNAISINLQPDRSIVVSDGPYLEANNYVDGFWILECTSSEEAVEWGRKAALACGGSVEVRPFAGAVVG